jgi:hydroxypyruvate reductase
MVKGALQALTAAGVAHVPVCVMGPKEWVEEFEGKKGALVLHGDHPLSTARNQQGAARVMEWLCEVGPRGEVLVLLSGGASAYLVSPMGGLQREELDAVYAAIRGRGGSIEELNAVRKHCEAMKGGRLAGLARKTRVLVMSDVLGDRLDVISSGPFVADESTCEDAAGVMKRLGLEVEYPRVMKHVSDSRHETPKCGDARFARVTHRVLMNNKMAMEALEAALTRGGVRVVMRVQDVRGEPMENAQRMRRAIQELQSGEGVVLGGEPTVDVRHAAAGARGGPSQEWVLALANVCEERGVDATVWGLSTDGQDGNSPYAGGWLTSSMVSRARNRGSRSGLVLSEFREKHDASSFLEEAAGEFFTGPTGVNVNHVACVVRTA